MNNEKKIAILILMQRDGRIFIKSSSESLEVILDALERNPADFDRYVSSLYFQYGCWNDITDSNALLAFIDKANPLVRETRIVSTTELTETYPKAMEDAKRAAQDEKILLLNRSGHAREPNLYASKALTKERMEVPSFAYDCLRTVSAKSIDCLEPLPEEARQFREEEDRRRVAAQREILEKDYAKCASTAKLRMDHWYVVVHGMMTEEELMGHQQFER